MDWRCGSLAWRRPRGTGTTVSDHTGCSVFTAFYFSSNVSAMMHTIPQMMPPMGQGSQK